MVSDITYLVVADGFAYLSLITDAFSKKVVGFYLSQTLEASGSVSALQMALADCKDVIKLIYHSDRGVQYCSTAYVNLLNEKVIKISMTENGNPLDNAIAERVNSILKDELLQAFYIGFEKAKKDVAQAIVVYNPLRPHSSCNMLNPIGSTQARRQIKKAPEELLQKEGGGSSRSLIGFYRHADL